MTDLETTLAALADTVTEYVSDKATGDLLGAIVFKDRWHYVCAVLALHGGDWRNTDNMVACRRYYARKTARNNAAAILNEGHPVNIAAVL